MTANSPLSQLQCQHFGECGGCQYLDVNYKEQLRLKRKKLEETFSFLPKLKIPEIVASPEYSFYRHKLQLPFGVSSPSKTAPLQLGCHDNRFRKVVNQQECVIQENSLSQIAYIIRSWAQKNHFSAYNPKTGQGNLRHILLKKGWGTGEILIGLVCNFDRIPGIRNLGRSLLQDIEKKFKGSKPNIVGIVQNINLRQTKVVLGQKEQCWWGRPFLFETIGQYRFALGLSNFFQVNPYQTPNLYNEVASHLEGKPTCLEFYSGIGSISLWISQHAQKVVAIEENPQSVSAARKAAEKNQVANVTFVAGKAEEKIAQFSKEDFDIAIFDPPRKGLHQSMVDAIKNSSFKKLVYVSCNPETLARDAGFLKAHYRLSKLKGFDMFPHTEHLECVAMLERN